MIYLARINDGVVMFDAEQKTIISIRGLSNDGDVSITWDVSELLKDPTKEDYSYTVSIRNDTNPELFKALDNFHGMYYALIKSGMDKYSYKAYDQFNTSLCSEHSFNGVEVSYPSDSGTVLYEGMLGILKRAKHPKIEGLNIPEQNDDIIEMNYVVGYNHLNDHDTIHSLQMRAPSECAKFPEAVILFKQLLGSMYLQAAMLYDEAKKAYKQDIGYQKERA